MDRLKISPPTAVIRPVMAIINPVVLFRHPVSPDPSWGFCVIDWHLPWMQGWALNWRRERLCAASVYLLALIVFRYVVNSSALRIFVHLATHG